MSAQAFEDVRKLIEYYRLDTLAQSLTPKEKVQFETEDREITHILDEFLQLASEFLKQKNQFSTNRGALTWLDWIYRVLELEAKLMRTVVDKTYNSYNSKTQWYIEFATDAMVEIIQRVQKWLRKETTFYKSSRLDYASLRQAVICVLANLTYSMFTIVFAIIKVNKGELKPQGLYEVVADALRHTEHLC